MAQAPEFVADNRFEIVCAHCDEKFWAFDLLAIRVCPNCFRLGHRGNGGSCWKCRSDYYSADEPFATHEPLTTPQKGKGK